MNKTKNMSDRIHKTRINKTALIGLLSALLLIGLVYAHSVQDKSIDEYRSIAKSDGDMEKMHESMMQNPELIETMHENCLRYMESEDFSQETHMMSGKMM